MRIDGRWVGVAVVVLGLGTTAPLSAHSMEQAAILLDFRDAAIDAELQVPAERLQSAIGIQQTSSVSSYLLNGLSVSLPDGRRFAVKPISGPHLSRAGLFDLHCSLLIDRIPSEVVLVSIRTDWRTSTFANEPQLAGVLHGADRTLRCLRQIGKIVTEFTAGHSVTLTAGAMNLVHVPRRPGEVVIAASILIFAVHAFRPLFPGREAAIAGCFGLVHRMAFETMQLLVVAAGLPSLILLSRTRLYPSIRIAGPVFAGAAAAAWIVQRLWDVPNPAEVLVTALAQRAGWIAPSSP
jgi:HupE / UreJ protein